MTYHRTLATLFGLWCGAAAPAQTGDNVLIVVADDLGVDQVAAYGEGGAPPRTTNVDALAARGVLFRNAWAAPSCSPARACLMTGRYGYRTGVGSPGAMLSANEISLPEALDTAGSGYAHAWIGKWHLGGGATQPNVAGWSHFAGLTGGGVRDYYRWTRTVNGQSAITTTYATTQIADDAIAWIQSQSGPWLCVLAFNAPHTPFHVPPAGLHSQTLTGTPTTNSIPHYKAAVEALDAELGRVLASLGSELARTNVIFLGDNGTPRAVTEAPFVRNHSKGTPYEGGVRVPFVVAGPAVSAGGREVSSVVAIADLFATAGELIGHQLVAPVIKSDSVSFAPYLANPSAGPQRAAIYAEGFTNGIDPLTDGFACVRDEAYKLIRRYAASGAATEELYHLPTDPFEGADLFSGGLTAGEQAARDRLAAHIDAVRDTTGRFAPFGGAGCIGSNGPPQISGAGTPTLGQSYDVRLSQGVSTGLVALTVGASKDAFGGIPLPVDLQLLGGGPGCFLYTSLEVTIPTATDPAGQAQISVPLPDEDLLLAGSIFHTWLGVDPGAPNNPLMVVTSPGLTAVPGR
ncbi:MAG: sulfatase-like hydrolase/transferase [Planctomycetota bacterium]